MAPTPATGPTAIADTLAIVPLADVDPTEVEALLDAAFGADRHARTAYRLREGLAAVPDLSFATVDGDGRLVASLQSWPLELAGDDGTVTPLLLVGPIAVDPARQQAGLGQALTRHALAAVDATGAGICVLIGDPEYYGRFFGFSSEVTGGWRLPGPVERRRLMTRGADVTNLPRDGVLRPQRP
jgi:predicted N-acetyltransferase YhbS